MLRLLIPKHGDLNRAKFHSIVWILISTLLFYLFVADGRTVTEAVPVSKDCSVLKITLPSGSTYDSIPSIPNAEKVEKKTPKVCSY